MNLDDHVVAVSDLRAQFVAASTALLAREEIMLLDLAAGYAAGTYTADDLVRVWVAYRDHPIPGHATRWKDAGLPHRQALKGLQRDIPMHPDMWEGTAHLWADDPAPPHGHAVVYFLYLAEELVYIGSTDRFRHRLRQHRNDGRSFTRWVARRCASRQAAYDEEAREVATHRPPGNRIPVRSPGGHSVPEEGFTTSPSSEPSPVDKPVDNDDHVTDHVIDHVTDHVIPG